MDSKNKRKFRHWDNKLLFDVYQKAVQISGKIEEKCNDEVSPDMLPESLIPTDMLYDLTSCFEAMYDKLMEEELVTAGFPKSSKTNH
jgi:hypothetical protein